MCRLEKACFAGREKKHVRRSIIHTISEDIIFLKKTIFKKLFLFIQTITWGFLAFKGAQSRACRQLNGGLMKLVLPLDL
ncbi:hypothetical protein HK19_06580 [Acetobacter persici]|nr:hypothetical protein HK19_06580 [Acetobacter persici]